MGVLVTDATAGFVALDDVDFAAFFGAAFFAAFFVAFFGADFLAAAFFVAFLVAFFATFFAFLGLAFLVFFLAITHPFFGRTIFRVYSMLNLRAKINLKNPTEQGKINRFPIREANCGFTLTIYFV